MKLRGLDLAVLCLFLAMVVAGLVVLFDPPPEPPPPLAEGLISVAPSRDLDGVAPHARVHLDLRTNRPLHVAIWRFVDARAERVFPPLSMPPGQPWPLPPDEEKGWRLPFGDRGIDLGPPGEGHLVVFARDDATPRPLEDIVRAPDNATREARLREHGQHFLRFKVEAR